LQIKRLEKSVGQNDYEVKICYFRLLINLIDKDKSEIINKMIEAENLLTIKDASVWATDFLGKSVTPSNNRLPCELR